MSGYLEEAAQLLRKAAETNERKNAGYTSDLNKNRLEIADGFARLGAIERGVLPPDWVADVLKKINEGRTAP
jgi:hypothetical protein